MKRLLKGCLTLIGIIFVMVFSCSVYVHHPHFSGSSPVAIDVVPRWPAYTDTPYQTQITNRVLCDAIFRELRSARFVGFGAKAHGELGIHFDNGAVDRILLVRSSQDEWVFFHHGFYRMPTERFFSVLKDAGVDVSRLSLTNNAAAGAAPKGVSL
jgi:hypothetical protein